MIYVTAPTPPITIGVLTSEDRNQLLSELLESLSEAGDVYGGTTRVVIAGRVEESSLDEAFELLTLSYEYVRTDGSTPEGRSRVVEECDTEWVLFVDDDCTVKRDILEVYADAISRHGREEVGAMYGQVLFEGNRTEAFQAFRLTPFIHPFQIAGYREEVEWATTANALFSREAILEVGLFDQSNPVAVSGEDVDIGLRLREAGYRGITVSDAVIYHTTSTWNDLWSNLRRCYYYGRSEAWLVRSHPGRSRPLFNAGSRRRGALWAIVVILLFPASATALFGREVLSWLKRGRSPSLRAHLLSHLYLATNYAGYAEQHLRSGGASWRVFERFVFYEHDYVQREIVEEGPVDASKHRNGGGTNDVSSPMWTNE